MFSPPCKVGKSPCKGGKILLFSWKDGNMLPCKGGKLAGSFSSSGSYSFEQLGFSHWKKTPSAMVHWLGFSVAGCYDFVGGRANIASDVNRARFLSVETAKILLVVASFAARV
ncbi:hypothetical protein ACH5RR_001205 [Cinchona calisaya]|uniref:Uncharacterized protein n=1 Tax=Cinchona calisaya TaxID=153742 RepID=A0ABD3B2V3_9GENT